MKYRGTSAEYARFSKAMNLPQQRERVTVDGLGNIGVGKYKSTSNAGVPLKTVEKFYKIVIIKAGKQSLDEKLKSYKQFKL